MPKRNCKYCKGEFSWMRVTTQFCNSICRWNWNYHNNPKFREMADKFSSIRVKRWIKQKRLKKYQDDFVDREVVPGEKYEAYKGDSQDKMDWKEFEKEGDRVIKIN